MSEDAKYLGPLMGTRAHTPSATAFVEGRPCRALIASEDMTADIQNDAGVTVAGVPLNRGLNPIAALKVTAVSVGSIFVGF